MIEYGVLRNTADGESEGGADLKGGSYEST